MTQHSSFQGAPEVLVCPATPGQSECMGCSDRARKPGWRFRRCFLKIQYRVLALVEAGSTKVRRVPEAVFVRLLRIYMSASSRNSSQFIAGELMGPAYNLGKLFFKFEFFFLRPRQLILKQRLLALDGEYSALCSNEACEKCGCGLSDFAGVALSDKSFGDGLCAGDGCDGHLNFTEHGCPSDGTVRVEELALSVGEGGHQAQPCCPAKEPRYATGVGIVGLLKKQAKTPTSPAQAATKTEAEVA